MTHDQPRWRIDPAHLLATTLGAIAFSFSAATAAPAAPLPWLSPPVTPDERVGTICSLIVGLPTGPYSQYEACKDGLSHSFAAAKDEGRILPDMTKLPDRRVTSYFSASNGEIHRREVSACAQIGSNPATAAFAQCLADLQFDLFDADHPL